MPDQPRAAQRGDIYLVSLDPSFGHEQRGRRPVFVVTSRAFNEKTNAPVVLPVTTGGGFARRAGFSVELTGLHTTGVVRCDQPRAMDLRARGGKRLETAPEKIIAEVMARLTAILE